MRGWRTVVLSALLLTTALAGCLGGDEDSSGDQVLKEQAKAGDRTGGIQGVVTDTAIQPVEGANVTLLEIDQTATTASDGSYAFSDLEPGTYTVSVNASGFVSTRNETQVSAGQVNNVDFLLTHLQSTEAYTQVFELKGFFECGAEAGWDLRDEAPDNPAPFDGGRYFFLGVAACAGANIAGNTTNDKFMHIFELDPPLNTVIYEMQWEANSQTSEWLGTQLEVEGFSNDAIGRFWRHQGPSPVYERLDEPVWENLSANFTEACENGTDDYCGYSFRDEGWPLQTRVFPAWQCQTQDAGACVVAQQEFTHYISAFYNAPAPEGYSIVNGTTEQG